MNPRSILAQHRSVMIATVSGFLLTAWASASKPNALPVDLVEGRMIGLWGVVVDATPNCIVVSGYARRSRMPVGPVNEHIHALVIDAAGQTLSEQDVEWNGKLTARSQSSKFSVTLADTAGVPSRVRVAVVPGVLTRRWSERGADAKSKLSRRSNAIRAKEPRQTTVGPYLPPCSNYTVHT